MGGLRPRHFVRVGVVLAQGEKLMIDFALMAHYLPLMTQAIITTIQLSVMALVLGLVVGLVVALARRSDQALIYAPAAFFVWLIRSTPLLVQLFIIYFGLPQMGVDLSPVTAGVLGLGINVGAYNAETIRSGIQAIDIGQHEAAKSLGMTPAQAMRRIILPQAFRIIIPPLGNNFIILIKDSSLVSTITVVEVTMRTQQFVGSTFKPFEMYLLAALIYAVLTSVVALGLRAVEKRMRAPHRRAVSSNTDSQEGSPA